MGEHERTHGEPADDEPPLSEQEANELLERYEHLVYDIAHRLQHQLPDQVEIEDLVGWGYTGLFEAYQRYDESRSTRFTTYAYYRIRGAMLDGCPEPILNPANEKIETGCNEVLHTYAHVVRAHENKASLESRLSMLSDVTGTLMLVYVLGESPNRALKPDGAPHKQRLTRRQNAQKVREALTRLSGNERRVLEGVYLEDRSLSDIADELELSTSWVSRLHTRALRRLRNIIERNDEFEDLRHAIPI